MFKLFKNLSKIDVMFLLGVTIFTITQVVLELQMPDYMSEITRLVQTPESEMGGILKNGGLMLLCALGALIASIVAKYYSSRLATNFPKNVRSRLFYKIQKLDYDKIKQFSTSSLITRSTNDIAQVQNFISMGTGMLIRAPITAFWAITKIANKSWQWSLTTAIAVAILLTMVFVTMALVMPKFKIVQKLLDKLNGVTRENLNGIRVVHAFNAEKYQERKFDKTNTELTNLRIFNQRVMSVIYPMINLIMYGVTLAIYFIGAALISAATSGEKLTLFSDMVVFSTYAMQVIMSFLFLSMIFMILPRAQVSAERINEVMDTVSLIEDGKEEKSLEELKGTVEFRNVYFKYPDAEEYLLEDISFTAERGQTVAFIGSTGAGKSTLINLVPRFYDASQGEVLVDGVNVKDYKIDALNDKLGYVAQKAVLFSGSIESNVAFGKKDGKKIAKDAVKKAVAVAQAKDFVEKKDKRYQSRVAQGGSNLSGGQKQRLSIARAVAREPEIFIFDDSFSALDYKTDAALRKALKEEAGEATSLIVAQRVGTIMNADKILVLDKGKCVGQGTHKELLKSCPIYKQIAMSQLSKEELNV